jgi:hypothetical protein
MRSLHVPSAAERVASSKGGEDTTDGVFPRLSRPALVLWTLLFLIIAWFVGYVCLSLSRTARTVHPVAPPAHSVASGMAPSVTGK